eukprot:1158296-Pyramimonas_sp.AAC.1
MAPRRLRGLQDAQRGLQEVSQVASRGPTHRFAFQVSKVLGVLTFRLPDAPRGPLVGRQTTPRRPKNEPKIQSFRPKEVPKMPQEAPRRPPEAPKRPQ